MPLKLMLLVTSPVLKSVLHFSTSPRRRAGDRHPRASSSVKPRGTFSTIPDTSLSPRSATRGLARDCLKVTPGTRSTASRTVETAASTTAKEGYPEIVRTASIQTTLSRAACTTWAQPSDAPGQLANHPASHAKIVRARRAAQPATPGTPTDMCVYCTQSAYQNSWFPRRHYLIMDFRLRGSRSSRSQSVDRENLSSDALVPFSVDVFLARYLSAASSSLSCSLLSLWCR
jgi:hypothetical protein